MKKSTVIQFFVFGVLFVFINLKIAEYYHTKGFASIVKSGSDSEGYYQYLPYLFINKDILHQPYGVWLENSFILNKYTCGVAILETPFFFVAHILSNMKGQSTTGFDNIYGYFIVMAACVYMYIALFVLYRLLSKQFRESIAFISIAAIYLATNLFYYTIIESGMSHVYSFFCFTMFIYYVDKYYEEEKLKDIIVLGFFLALATLIRPTNLLLILLFIFYKTYNFSDFKERIIFHLKRYYHFIIFLIIGLIVFSPQMYYWQQLTGKYIFYSYQNETFINWSSPKILEVLVGHKSGWLLYSPIMLFSIIGLTMAMKQKVLSAPAISLIFILILYICASWWAYTFGCGFGYRSFSEYSAILIFPMALFLNQGLINKKMLLRLFIIFGLIVFTYYNLKITRLYYLSGGCWDGPNWHWTDYLEVLKKVF